MDNYQERLLRAIPGGCHTYSRGFDQFPENAPSILKKGKGAHVWDMQGNTYIDYGMALRAVTLGYANESVNKAAYEEINNGNGLTRPSEIELIAAEKLIELIPCADMVKFAKNGSNVTTAACKIARSYTERNYIAIPNEQPFFSFDDWFIGKTKVQRGIPEAHSANTLMFNYGDINSVKLLFEKYPDQIAGVMLEPATTLVPCKQQCGNRFIGGNECIKCDNRQDNFLVRLSELCKKNGALLIFDEMITGFRWNVGGAQKYFGVTPDLATFGKAMANGFSLAALTGKREVMELGNINKKGLERTFLLSSTHGAEMSSMGAFVKTIEIYEKENVIHKLWENGRLFKEKFKEIINENKLEDHFEINGPDICLNYITKDVQGNICGRLRTLFSQEMIRNGVIMPWISISTQHDLDIINKTMDAVDKSLKIYKNAIEKGVDHYLAGESIKPVFRKYN